MKIRISRSRRGDLKEENKVESVIINFLLSVYLITITFLKHISISRCDFVCYSFE